MTIGAVSSINSFRYSTSVEYKYFGTTFSDQTLQDLMRQYGIIQTGDSDTDVKALYQAMYSSAITQTTAAKASGKPQHAKPEESQSSSAQNANNVPWATLMNQVGLSPTGDLATDLTAFNNKISQMMASATTQQEKANLYQLAAEASIVFVQPESASQSNISVQSSSLSHSISGADIMARLNKLMMVG